MKILFKILLILIAFDISAQVDPAIKGYYNDFLNEAQTRSVKLNTSVIKVLGFPSKSNQHTIDSVLNSNGTKQWNGCVWTKKGFDGKFIFFNPVYYFQYGETTRRIVVYHELMHALMDIKDGQFAIMTDRTVYQTKWNEQNLKQAISEVFNYYIATH